MIVVVGPRWLGAVCRRNPGPSCVSATPQLERYPITRAGRESERGWLPPRARPFEIVDRAPMVRTATWLIALQNHARAS
jgi:hypothetical protein